MTEQIWQVSATYPDGHTHIDRGVTDDKLTESIWDLIGDPPIIAVTITITEETRP